MLMKKVMTMTSQNLMMMMMRYVTLCMQSTVDTTPPLLATGRCASCECEACVHMSHGDNRDRFQLLFIPVLGL